MKDKNVVCIVGVGYVGLPLAMAFAKANLDVIGFDINQKRIDELKENIDCTNEAPPEEIKKAKITFTSDPTFIKKADFVIVAVPTPINENKIPDFKALTTASETLAKNLKKGAIVIYESTVYPGATEDICVPILEKKSGLRCGKDFKIAYSPERINPGDKVHTIDKIKKIVSAMDDETVEKVAQLYSSIISAGIYKAPSIKVAEAAKVIENTQRDLNIALVNEFSLIFNKMGIPTREILKAASTKWNFHAYVPGLVGGHCISVDPHYLLYKSRQIGYNPKVILAGRDINDYMPVYVADLAKQGVSKAGKDIRNSNAYVLGLTFKENLNDIRNSKSKDVIANLRNRGFSKIFAYDPHINEKETKEKFDADYLGPNDAKDIDVILLLVSHKEFESLSLDFLKGIMSKNSPVIIDVKFFYGYEEAKNKGFIYYSL